jgi:hypothetical protein
MKLLRLILLSGVSLIAAACGKVAPLEPAAGQPLPVKPLLASSTPTAEQLLTPPTYARPERIDELMKRSAPREPDRFDLPPPDGGAAPVLPETEEPSSSEQKGPVDPQ